MPRPASYPTIASDANFTSGPKSGQPTKLALANPAQGYVPGQDALGQQVNYYQKLNADWLIAHSEELDALQAATSLAVTPPSSSNNNFNPTGWMDAARVHFTGWTGTRDITGIAAPTAGKPFVKYFTSDAAGTLRFMHESSSSSSANRIAVSRQVPGQSTHVAVRSGDSGLLIYSTQAARWYALSATPQNTLTSSTKTLAGSATSNDVAWTTDELNSDVLTLAVSGGGIATVTGLAVPTDPRYKSGIKLVCITGSVTFAHEDTGSSTGNRFIVTGGANWAAVSGDFAYLQYSPEVQRWIVHPLRPPGSGGSSAELEISASPSGSLNDYSPTSWQDATCVSVAGTATITGFAAPGAGKPTVKRLIVRSGVITIVNQSASSTTTNRVVVPNPILNGGGVPSAVLAAGDVALLVYSTTDSRWHVHLSTIVDEYALDQIAMGGTNNSLGLGNGRASLVSIGAGAAGPYVINGFTAPTGTTRAFPKLLKMLISVLVAHENAAATAADRIRLTTGKDWSAVSGDLALLSYDKSASRWIVHPLVSGAGLTPENSSLTTLDFVQNKRIVYTGATACTLGVDETNARDNVEQSVFFPAGSLTTFALDPKLDPNGTLAYAFDDTGAAYLYEGKFLKSGPCVRSSFCKVYDL